MIEFEVNSALYSMHKFKIFMCDFLGSHDSLL